MWCAVEGDVSVVCLLVCGVRCVCMECRFVHLLCAVNVKPEPGK